MTIVEKHDRHPKNYHNLSINTVDRYRNKSDIKEERDMKELDLAQHHIY